MQTRKSANFTLPVQVVPTGLRPAELVLAAIEAPFHLDVEPMPPGDLHYAIGVVAEQKGGISA